MNITTFNVRNTFDDDGNLVMKYGVSAINESLKTLLYTTTSELLGDPGFGSKLQRLDKNNLSEVLRDILQDSIREAISVFDPRIEVMDIEILNVPNSAMCVINISYAHESDTSWITLYVSNEGD